MKFLVLGILVGFSLWRPADSRAYLREDHHATVRVALEGLTPPIEGSALVGMCAQLPDEAPEISAIDVYRRLMKHPLDYSAWAVGKSGPDDTVGRMLTVQQLLHGLTGGRPEGVRTVAKSAIRDILVELRSLPKGALQERSNTLCALGFAFHLYGDSFSHQRIKNPDKMYDTGIGHLFDSTMPDLPLFSAARLELWKGYMASLADLLPHKAAADLRSLIAETETSRQSARKNNSFNLEAFRQVIATRLKEPIAPFDPSLKSKGCQAIADRQAAVIGFAPAPQCEEVWAIFRDRAIEEYDAYDSDEKHAGKESRAPSSMPYFMESPFAEGANR